MFDQRASGPPERVGTAVEALSWVGRLGRAELAEDDAARIDEIEALERVKSAAAARQARLTAAFAASQRRAQRAAGSPDREVGRGIAAQVGLARHDSPVRGARHLGLARALVEELPATFAALARGDISEWRATLVARETACLSRADRAAVDARLGPRLAGWGDARVGAEARRLAYAADPGAALRRGRKAEADRNVSLRPAPDTMTYLTGLLPVADGVAAHAALVRHADAAKAAGDARSRGQIMADEMTARLTGRAAAGRAGGASDVEVVLVVGTGTLAAGPTDQGPAAGTPGDGGLLPAASPPVGSPADQPGWLAGYGPVPAWWARRLVREATGRVWLRRAFADPADGTLARLESRRRIFPEGLRKALIVRDLTCRTPWCDAPIRHADHVTAAADGGDTSLPNGQGLCQACNLAKTAPGWRARPSRTRGSAAVETVTPTGHAYRSNAPPLPGHERSATPRVAA